MKLIMMLMLKLFAMDEAASLLQETGFSRPVCSLNVGDKASLSALIINYHYMIKPKAAVDQFNKGLDTLIIIQIWLSLTSLI